MKKTLLFLVMSMALTSVVSASAVATNLLKNGNFNQVAVSAPHNWLLGKDVNFNKETKVISAAGKSYNILSQKIVLPAGKEYTIKIKARKVTSDGSLGVLFLTAPNARGIKEHTVAWKIPLSKNFSTIAFTVKSIGIKQLNIYRTSGNNSVIEVAEVALFEGKPNDVSQNVNNQKLVSNLIKNPSFCNYYNGVIANWILGKNVLHQSWDNGFIITANNNSYVALVQDLTLKAGTEYTIVVTACNFGKDGKLGILPQKYEGKKLVEAKSIVWNHPLTKEYVDYSFTFKAPSNKIRLNFYRLGDKKASCGIKIAKVILFEGK